MATLAIRTEAHAPHRKRNNPALGVSLAPDALLLTRRSTVLRDLLPEARQLLYRLFDSPMTMREALSFFDASWKLPHRYQRVNTWARARFGMDAILKQSLRGTSRPTQFWVLRLNPNLFDVDYTRYDIREHVRLADVIEEVPARLLVEKLAALGCASIAELLAAGIRPRAIHSYVHHRNQTINPRTEARGFPPVLDRTRTFPRLFFVHRPFAEIFNIPIHPRADLAQMFLPSDVAVIRHLSENGSVRFGVLSAQLGIADQELERRINRIQERCRELGLPIAIKKRGSYNLRIYYLTPSFGKTFQLDIHRRKRLDLFFTKKQIEVIDYLRAHPFSRVRDLEKNIPRARKKALELRIRSIRRTCTEKNLPDLLQIGAVRSRYALSPAFLALFHLEAAAVHPSIVLAGKQQRKIYRYFERNPAHTIARASRRLHIDDRYLSVAIKKNNRLLAAAGFSPIVPDKVKARYHAFYSIVEALIHLRMERGHWPPTLHSLRRAHPKMAYAIERLHGGFDGLMRKVADQIKDEQIRDIVANDIKILATWDFSQYADGGTVQRAFGGALLRGAERSTLLRILQTTADTSAALSSANALATRNSDPLRHFGVRVEAPNFQSGNSRGKDEQWQYSPYM